MKNNEDNSFAGVLRQAWAQVYRWKRQKKTFNSIFLYEKQYHLFELEKSGDKVRCSFAITGKAKPDEELRGVLFDFMKKKQYRLVSDKEDEGIYKAEFAKSEQPLWQRTLPVKYLKKCKGGVK